MKISKFLLGLATLLFVSTTVQARDTIVITGSSTVYPFATVVAEEMGRNGYNTPVVESTGSGGGMKIFCQGVGLNTPDITNASRPIKDSEVELCGSNGVTPIEYMIGYEGIVIGQSKKSVQFPLTKETIFEAVSLNVYRDGKFIPNPNKKWSDIDSSLPDLKIDMMIPPPTSGTRDAFVELVLHGYCKKSLGLSKADYKANCSAVREDGYIVEMGENDNLILSKLQGDEKRLGVFGFSFLDQNRDKVQGLSVEGVMPEFESIADGSYSVSRSLFFYVKQEHLGVVPGIEQYVGLFEELSEPGEYLSDIGLIPVQ